MKRFLIVAILIAFVLAALAVVPRVLPVASMGAAVERELSETLGLDITSAAPAELTLFPTPAFRLATVAVSTKAGAEIITSDSLSLRLDPLALLAGSITIKAITMQSPNIALRITPDGRRSWDSVAAAFAEARQSDATMPKLRLIGGRLTYRDEIGGRHIDLSGLDARLALSNGGRLRVEGQAVWRREAIEALIDITDIAALKAGGTTAVDLRLDSLPAALRFSGKLDALSGLHAEGALAVDAAAADRLGLWLTGGWDRTHWPQGALRLRADLRRLPGTLNLNDVNLSLGGTRATGAIVFKGGARPLVQGTFAASLLEIGPLLRPLAPYANTANGWSTANFATPVSFMDTELRVSADRMTLGATTFENAALLLDIHGGGLSLRAQDVTGFDGTLSAALRATPDQNGGMALKASLTGRNLALSRMSEIITPSRRIDGRGDLSLELEGTGVSPDDLASQLNGAITFTARDGAIHGIDVDQGLRRLERSPLALREARGGRTSFAHLAASIDITKGVMSLSHTRLESPEFLVTLDGFIDIAERTLDLAGIALRREDGTARPILPFKLDGTWRAPAFRPDVNTLLRRSGAAAPLFPAAQTPAATQP